MKRTLIKKSVPRLFYKKKLPQSVKEGLRDFQLRAFMRFKNGKTSATISRLLNVNYADNLNDINLLMLNYPKWSYCVIFKVCLTISGHSTLKQGVSQKTKTDDVFSQLRNQTSVYKKSPPWLATIFFVTTQRTLENAILGKKHFIA